MAQLSVQEEKLGAGVGEKRERQHFVTVQTLAGQDHAFATHHAHLTNCWALLLTHHLLSHHPGAKGSLV